MADAESQPGSAFVPPSREEGIEEAVYVGGVDACAIVVDFEYDAARERGRSNEDLAYTGRLDRVLEQVLDDLLDLRAVPSIKAVRIATGVGPADILLRAAGAFVGVDTQRRSQIPSGDEMRSSPESNGAPDSTGCSKGGLEGMARSRERDTDPVCPTSLFRRRA